MEGLFSANFSGQGKDRGIRKTSDNRPHVFYTILEVFVKNNLNGWERLWVFLSVIYWIVISTLFLIYKPWPNSSVAMPSVGHVLWGVAAFIVPVILLYFLGVGVSWVYQGYKIYGFKKAQGWSRAWIVLSGIFLVASFGNAFEAIRDETLRKRVLSQSFLDEGYYEVIKKENIKMMPVYFSGTGYYTTKIGEAENKPSIISTLNKSGGFRDGRGKMWDAWYISRELALSVMDKTPKYWFTVSILQVLVLWVYPPIVGYIVIYLLVSVVIWISAGFRVDHKRLG